MGGDQGIQRSAIAVPGECAAGKLAITQKFHGARRIDCAACALKQFGQPSFAGHRGCHGDVTLIARILAQARRLKVIRADDPITLSLADLRRVRSFLNNDEFAISPAANQPKRRDKNFRLPQHFQRLGKIMGPLQHVARDMLQRAHNLTETLEMLRQAKVFVSTLWLIGSRADGKFIVVEKTPDATQVREAESDWIVCANHFETPGLREDPRNQRHIAVATSVSRKTRLTELLQSARGTIDAPRAVEFLRDRKLPGGTFAGNGNRGALNALIATHATVMDLTDGIFWAASPPNQLGKFVAFDVADFSRELPAMSVDADPMIASGEFDRARDAQKLLGDGWLALKKKDAQPALSLAEKAESLNPGFYQNAALRGQALLALGRREEANLAFAAALAAKPAFLKEKQEIEALLQEE